MRGWGGRDGGVLPSVRFIGVLNRINRVCFRVVQTILKGDNYCLWYYDLFVGFNYMNMCIKKKLKVMIVFCVWIISSPCWKRPGFSLVFCSTREKRLLARKIIVKIQVIMPNSWKKVVFYLHNYIRKG